MARESWAKVLWTTMVAIKLHVGTVRAGWSLDFPSGLQVCFFFNIHQTGNFDLYQSLEWNLKRSPFFLGRPEADMFPEVIPETTPEQWYSDLRDRLISQHFNPRLTMTAVEFTAMGAGSWGGAVPIPADCEAAISHLAIESWFIARTGITLAGPRLETDGRCTLGIYLTNPLDPITKDTRPFWRVQGMGIDIVHEATKLLRTLGNQRRGGGYVNLPNGLEICLYDQSFLDPSNVCAKMTKMRLRDCLDNRAQAMRRKLAAATETTRTTKLRSIPAATTKAAAAALRIPLGH
ncbi:hypothetical protein MMC34_005992 [Xylographa carneopallida]|nr:hypothetical protein [Xylographa carneopallida]